MVNRKEITEFFEKYLDKVNWNYLCQNINIEKSRKVFYCEKYLVFEILSIYEI